MREILDLEEFAKALADKTRKLVADKYDIHMGEGCKGGTVQPTVIFAEKDDEGNVKSTVFYCGNIFETDYLNDECTIDEIAGKLVKTREELTMPCTHKELDALMAYERARKELYMILDAARPDIIDYYDRHDIVYRSFLDMVISYDIRLDDEHSAKVNCGLLKTWQVTEEQLFHDALESYSKIATPELRDMETGFRLFKEFDLGDCVNLLESADVSYDMGSLLVLSDSRRYNSASVILDGGVMQKAGRVVGHDFYLIPSSRHEMLIPLAFDVTEPEGLLEMVVNANANMVDAEDRLTDSVYVYHVNDKVLELVATANEGDWDTTYSYDSDELGGEVR